MYKIQILENNILTMTVLKSHHPSKTSGLHQGTRETAHCHQKILAVH